MSCLAARQRRRCRSGRTRKPGQARGRRHRPPTAPGTPTRSCPGHRRRCRTAPSASAVPGQPPVGGRELGDPGGRGVVPGVAGRRDDGATARCDHRGLQARHGGAEGDEPCRRQATARRRGVELADSGDLGRDLRGAVPPGDDDRAVAGPRGNARPVARRTLPGPGAGGPAGYGDDLDAAVQRPGRELMHQGQREHPAVRRQRRAGHRHAPAIEIQLTQPPGPAVRGNGQPEQGDIGHARQVAAPGDHDHEVRPSALAESSPPTADRGVPAGPGIATEPATCPSPEARTTTSRPATTT